MKRLLFLLIATMSVTATYAAEPAIVVAVKPHYVRASCQGCNMPVLVGYDVWWVQKSSDRKEPRADRLDFAPQVGDEFEVRSGRLHGRAISSRASEHRSRFLGDTSGS
jgi:hypothetical protein